MPTPLKPCDGHFSEELQRILHSNKDRAQWANHPCEVCGLEVSAKHVQGKWVPDSHWPTVKYPPRTPAGRTITPTAASSRQNHPVN